MSNALYTYSTHIVCTVRTVLETNNECVLFALYHVLNNNCVCSGILLKDLVAVDGQSKDYTNKEHKYVNMGKYKKLWQHLSRARQYQVRLSETYMII